MAFSGMPGLDAMLRASVDHLNRPQDVFYTEDVCDMRYEPGHIGIIERTVSDVDSHVSHPHTDDPSLQCHKDISRAAFRKFKHDGIPPAGTVLVQWQTKKFSELIPTTQLTLTDRSLVVGDVVKKEPKDAMSGTVRQTHMMCTLCRSSFKSFKMEHSRDYVPPLNEAVPFNVIADDLKLAKDYKEGDLIIYKTWVGRIDTLWEDVSIRLSNGSIVTVDADSGLTNMLDMIDDMFDVGGIVETEKGNLRRGRWIKGRYDPSIRPIGAIVHIAPKEFTAQWLRKWGTGGRTTDLSNMPPAEMKTSTFERDGGQIYDPSRSPRTATAMERSHTPFMSGDKVRFKDALGARVKYPQFDWLDPVDHSGFDINVFTVLITKTAAKIAWQDQTEEMLPGIAVVPDYNMEDDNEVWPGEIIISNEKVAMPADEEWIFQPKRVGVVQSVSPADRIAKVKWLPHAKVQYNQIGLDEHLDELSLLEGSTLGIEISSDADLPIEEVTLYDIRTIGALSRRRGDFVVIEGDEAISSDVNDREWFGEVIDLNLDGTLTIRLGASAKEVKDVRVSPEKTMLVYSSDTPDGLGWDDPFEEDDEDGFSTEYETDYESALDYEDLSGSDDGVWEVDGEPVGEDGEWDTESEDEGEDVVMKDAGTQTGGDARPSTNGHAKSKPVDSKSNADKDVPNTVAALDLSQIPLQEPSVTLSGTSNAPPAFDVLEGVPPSSHPYLTPDPPALTGARMKRIRKEHTILSTSLPPGIFVRTWESRLDLLRVLILGPLGTPYEYAPYVIDLRIPAEYPSVPPDAYFHSWTSGQGPVNPNLYENGKICLSLLGTWHSNERGEGWSAARSTVLQVLVSILGLVLVKEPYYNEAGFEARAGSEDAKVPSQLYSERTYFRSRAFITYALRNGVEGFDGLLEWLYGSNSEDAPKLLDKSIEAAKELIAAGDAGVDIRAGLKKMSRGAIIMLERQLKELEAVKTEKEGAKSA